MCTLNKAETVNDSVDLLAWNVKDFAANYDICENTARRIIYSKGFPYIKVGKRIVIIKKLAIEYMENLARSSGRNIYE